MPVSLKNRSQSVVSNFNAMSLQMVVRFSLRFMVRAAFVHALGVEYLGVNTFLLDLFQILSLLELGVESVFTYFLYKPVAEQNMPAIASLLKLFRQIYRFVCLGMSVLGLACMPLALALLQRGGPIPGLTGIYLLLLLHVVLAYTFAYKRCLFVAHQMEYVSTANLTFWLIVQSSIQIGLLYWTKSYYLFLWIQVISTLAQNLTLHFKAHKAFPEVNIAQAPSLEKAERTHIFSRVRAYFIHRLAHVAMFRTDTLLLSFFASLSFIGKYSNYFLVRETLNIIFTSIWGITRASVGNLGEDADAKTAHLVFKRMFFINSWLVGLASLSMYFLLSPFIALWMGPGMTLEQSFVLVLSLSFFLSGMRQTALLFCDAKGLFWNTRFRPVVEATLDVSSSLALALLFGPLGILLGNLVSLLLVSIWYDAYIVHREWFQLPVWPYLCSLCKAAATVLGTGLFIAWSMSALGMAHASFWLQSLYVLGASNLIFCLLAWRSAEFSYMLAFIKKHFIRA